MSSAKDIQNQIEKLQSQLDVLKKNARTKIDKMSSEVKDTNPYSRLMALQRMGELLIKLIYGVNQHNKHH